MAFFHPRPGSRLWQLAHENLLVGRQHRSLCLSCLSKGASSSAQPAMHTRAKPVSITRGPSAGMRALATMADHRSSENTTKGPLAEYDARVGSGRLRDDEHQRTLIQSLQDLHDGLVDYDPPRVVQPSMEELQPKKKGLLGSLFGGGSKSTTAGGGPMEGLPKGLYMYGDVGSGKTMLMDLFYDTLPANIQYKTRIHFHNFMQDVHKELHKMKMNHGQDVDAIPFVAASIASKASVLCFDEFQCTDVADAMILRRLIENLMHHGTVLVTTSNRHPSQLYKNGIQRASFIPCINLLLGQLRVLNLDSTTDYRKIPRPPSGVYHHPLDVAAKSHAEHWFKFLGDFTNDPPHPAVHEVWGREVSVPRASGRACHFTFQELMGRATGAADYLELMRSYESFVVTDVPGMNNRTRDLARRFITFVDAVYESRAKLVLTTAVPLTQLFMSRDELDDIFDNVSKDSPEKPNKAKEASAKSAETATAGGGLDDSMRMMMDDLGMNMETLKSSSIFSGEEEAFAFARALSRLSEMGSREWVERGMGLEKDGGRKEAESWQRVRSRWREDSM